MLSDLNIEPKHFYSGTCVTSGVVSKKNEVLAEEAPLQICINDTPFIITMRTPGNDEALVAGFLFSEGIIAEEGLRIAPIIKSHHNGLDSVKIEVPEIYICDDLRPSRALISYAACGICGSDALRPIEGDPLKLDQPFSMAQLPEMYGVFQQQQSLFKQTGGCHGAALFSGDGDLLVAYEDVGRHNAVDKCIGALIKSNQLRQTQVLLVSGRISFEIMVKAYHAGCPVVGAISAPSSLSVDMGTKFGISVIGFCRGDRATVYSHPEQVLESRNIRS